VRSTTYPVSVEFGDCDPAGIVFYPNFQRWMDAASLSFFQQCGVPPWRELEKTRGIVGTPLLEIHTHFRIAATYGQQLVVTTHVQEWRNKTFTQFHRLTRARPGGGEDLICEGTEVRVFVRRDAHDPHRLRAIPVPDDIRAVCEGEAPSGTSADLLPSAAATAPKPPIEGRTPAQQETRS
jgi:4-hydroxybenzoyl-CoA thioesterase